MLTDYENNLLAFFQSLNTILTSLIKESEETVGIKNNKIVLNTNISHFLLSLVLSEACKVV